MKVPGSNPTIASNTANVSALHNRGGQQKVEAGTGSAVEGGDHVQVSSLSSVLSTLNSQTESRASRLMELSSVVMTGRYHVDAQQVSAKMIQEHMRPAA